MAEDDLRIHLDEIQFMIWNNFLVDGVHEAAALLGYLASSLELSPGDVCAIDSVEQLVEQKVKIVLLIEDSHEFQGMKMVTVYLEEDVVVENSIFAFMERNFKIDIYLPDEDSGYYRDLVLLDKTGGMKRVTLQGS
ncbi:hypothetical protein N5C96_26180 [Delftia tsuruhatensis]|uniref:Uncharacterized protein n=1 Tax=Delftia tsuruhatensis TaxID=180282 RepID=A0AAX3SS83_9BURK|nr:hypothetical protein [Delftia tsuruhatensis]MDH0776906.1 hypothetical protein [Delftia tsuruhatensis]MDH1460990.1 hypothetical protein [Delftia tsuruhatensis]MDH1826938.1 hypothetical protein [Delftia tsuruhatensis]WFF82925.1 hypothetical protein PYR84_09570 [Delftia tsuruhatensis]WGG09252.1 hypothetical protein N5O86_21745 [Delftia tsuruhatensis]